MGFLNVLKKIVKVGEAVGPTVATAINPGAGALVGLIVNAVSQAEEAGGTGPAKKAAVIAAVLPTATTILNATLQARGAKTQIDSAQLQTAVGNLVDGVVALMNSVQDPAAATPGGTGTLAAGS